MTDHHYHIRPFSWELCRQLAPKLRQSDVDECLLSGMSVMGAMVTGALSGPTYLAMDGEYPVGIFGATYQGYIWGFCADLPLSAARAFLPAAPALIRHLREQTGKARLMNRVPKSARTNIAWLRRTGCFEFIPEVLSYEGADDWVHFQTRLHHLDHAHV